MIIVLLEPAFLFFVLTSGRPLPVTTFFVFSKPLCSADRDSGIFCTAAKALFIAVKGLSTAAKICGCCSPALLQLFCSASWSHSAALQQRCKFRTGVNVIKVFKFFIIFHGWSMTVTPCINIDYITWPYLCLTFSWGRMSHSVNWYFISSTCLNCTSKNLLRCYIINLPKTVTSNTLLKYSILSI